MPTYTNISASGYDIAERYRRRQDRTPAVLRRAWFADLEAAERFMSATPENASLRRIIDCQTGAIRPWRGVSGEGENALTYEQWAGFADEAASAGA